MHLILETTQLIPYFQGQFDRNSKMIGAEILMRMEFQEIESAIAEAEEKEVIDQLDAFAIQAAIEWSRIYDLPCSANISALTFASEEIINLLEQNFHTNTTKKSNLKLELTEGKGLTPKAKDNIHKLAALGYLISLDDCGSKYNTFYQIQELPFEEIKIDHRIIAEIATNSKSVAIVKAIVCLANAIDCKVVAEGVESKKQLEILIECGCDRFQGYLFGRPQKFDVF